MNVCGVDLENVLASSAVMLKNNQHVTTPTALGASITLQSE